MRRTLMMTLAAGSLLALSGCAGDGMFEDDAGVAETGSATFEEDMVDDEEGLFDDDDEGDGLY